MDLFQNAVTETQSSKIQSHKENDLEHAGRNNPQEHDAQSRLYYHHLHDAPGHLAILRAEVEQVHRQPGGTGLGSSRTSPTSLPSSS